MTIQQQHVQQQQQQQQQQVQQQQQQQQQFRLLQHLSSNMQHNPLLAQAQMQTPTLVSQVTAATIPSMSQPMSLAEQKRPTPQVSLAAPSPSISNQQPIPAQNQPLPFNNLSNATTPNAPLAESSAASTHAVPSSNPAVGVAILRMLQYGEHLCSQNTEQKKDIGHWYRFVEDYYSANGTMKYTLWHGKNQTKRVFDLKTKAIAHFYHTNFCCGVQAIQFCVEQIKEFTMVNGCLVADCPRASLHYLFEDGSEVHATGALRVRFTQGMKMESFEFDTQQHVELVPRSILQQVSDAATAAAKPPRRKKTDQATTVNGDKTTQTGMPISLVNEYGMVPDVMQVLQMSDTFHQMSDLFHCGNQSLPMDVMKQYCSLFAEMQHPMTNINANTNNNNNNNNNMSGNLNEFSPATPEPITATTATTTANAATTTTAATSLQQTPLSATPNAYAADINQLFASTMSFTPQQQAILASVTGMAGAVQPGLTANHSMMVGVKSELNSHSGLEMLQSPVLGGMLSPSIAVDVDPIGGVSGSPKSSQNMSTGANASATAATTAAPTSSTKKRNRNSNATPRPRKKAGSTSKAAGAKGSAGSASGNATEVAAHSGHHPTLLTGNP
ncbi:LIM-domain binding protein-domain-containing protein [Syncephalis plumigaleata]|nr:LIM-domain binding protein-domain-containing protein [Syncephalis plumigaleata]